MLRTERHPSATEQGQSWVFRKYEAFDGLRGLAVLLVFSRHYVVVLTENRHWQFGWVGVDLFFVLSGFLITGILYDSRYSPTFFRDFYIRRSLRIFPLYWGFFALILLLWPFEIRDTSRAIAAYALYVGNLFAVLLNRLGHNGNVLFLKWPKSGEITISHFWTLCVEEQFYLLWPLAVWMVRDRLQLMRLCGAGIIGAFICRVFLFHFDQHGLVYTSTPARCDSLLAGGMLALWLRGTRLTRSEFKRVAHLCTWAPLPLLGVGLAFTFHLGGNYDNPFMGTAGYDLLALVFVGVLMWAIDPQSRFAKALRRVPLLGRLGIVSYGFYLFHNMPFDYFSRNGVGWMHRHHVPVSLGVLALFFLMWALAETSFRLYERPLLMLKDRFAPVHRSVPA